MEECDIIKQLKVGDEVAFEYIFRNHFTGLCLFAEHFLKDPCVAEEIVEEFFFNLWDKYESIEINNSLRGYLYRSVYNRCLKYIRHKKVEKKYISEQEYYFFDKEILGTATNNYPLLNLISKELEDKISVIIESLPNQCKQVFCLNRFNNLSYKEISENMGISVNTVKTQMTRALQKLRKELNDYLVMLAALIVILNGFIFFSLLSPLQVT
ncbi:MAG: RNA polymerase sigma-70 factor [Bacteroidetes bacterium]|nr:RNA polymerase sigma-70 factor [Bacteroidota bacterium]